MSDESNPAWVTLGQLLADAGGWVVVVAGLLVYLGRLVEQRINRREGSALTREQDMLILKRKSYQAVARTLRVLQSRSDRRATEEEKDAFLAAYDESALWASEEVIHALGALLDLLTASELARQTGRETPLPVEKEAALVNCITAMRKDSGFRDTTYRHRIVSF